jgi:hypothetical protein
MGAKVKAEQTKLELLFLVLFVVLCCGTDYAQQQTPSPSPAPQEEVVVVEERQEEFGPVVRVYLSYLDAEQDVTDDRASRHEISRTYYRRNTNRITALRRVVLRIARETGNDYVPELEAVALDELHTLFEEKPNVKKLSVGDIFNNTFRYLGTVRVGVVFYIFERLDIYEQADLIKKQQEKKTESKPASATNAVKEGEKPKRPKSPEE